MSAVDRYTCLETFRSLDDYLDRELNADEMRLVREHLETCAVCAMEFAFEERLIGDILYKLRRIAAPAELREKVNTLLKNERAKPSAM